MWGQVSPLEETKKGIRFHECLSTIYCLFKYAMLCYLSLPKPLP